jgi:hypothetical protein
MDSARDFAVLSESPRYPAIGFAVEPQHCTSAVPIAEEVTDSVSVCERLDDLLRGPSPGRMLGHMEMQHLATIVFQDDKHEQDLHCDDRHGKEIGGHHVVDVVVQEGPPGLVRRPAESAQEARNSALGNGDTEHLEFAIDSGCSPQRIGGDHLCNQLAEFCGGAGATSSPGAAAWKEEPRISGTARAAIA